jgi:hypothetical protein
MAFPFLPFCIVSEQACYLFSNALGEPMIKISNDFYVNERLIAMAARDKDTGQGLIIFTKPLPIPSGFRTNTYSDSMSEEENEGADIVSGIAIEPEEAEIFFTAMDMLSFNVEEEIEDEEGMELESFELDWPTLSTEDEDEELEEDEEDEEEILDPNPSKGQN